MEPLYLHAMGLATPLGSDPEGVSESLFSGTTRGLCPRSDLIPGQTVPVGEVTAPLAETALPAIYNSRNNRLALTALNQIRREVEGAIDRFGTDRLAVVVGTSTSGLGDSEADIAHKVRSGGFPPDFEFLLQETGSLSGFLRDHLGLTGPAQTVSTACTSGAKALASACRLIRVGLADAALVGGADSLCKLTLNGFHALESLSVEPCQPFSRNRDGINIGEGAALFLLSKDPGPVAVLGIGETSDAYHISAPSPDGEGARRALETALRTAEVGPEAVGYLNLHGTATPLNDAMEAKMVAELFPDGVPCSSTKAMTGHALGAAGAIELAFLWLTLSPDWGRGRLPPHIWDGQADPDLPELELVQLGMRRSADKPVLLSSSFAFGGNNICIALGPGRMT
ncbi:MAG: beta-ketoacyl-[acyl-carrier-protein] synthase family protein [Magnetovibrionaceae bacterium]